MQRGQSQAISSGAQWQDNSEQAQTETQEISPEFQETCFSLWGVTEHWYSLPREVMESQFLEIIKSCLGRVLHDTLTVTLMEQRGWTKLPPGMPSNRNNFVIFTNVEFMKCLQFLGVNPGCLCSHSVYWGEFGLRQSSFTNTCLFSRLKCLLRSHKKWIRLKCVYLSCSASHILLAHCMLH